MTRIKSIAIVILFALSLGVTTAEAAELFGKIFWQNGRPANGVLLMIGGYSVLSDQEGSYLFPFVSEGRQVVSISPPGKKTNSFEVFVTGQRTQKDFTITW